VNIKECLEENKKYIDDVQSWADEEYDKYFSKYFVGQEELYKKLQNVDYIISDEELEWVLTALPLELFAVSEQMAKMKTVQEVIKLRIREKREEIVNTLNDTDTTGLSMTAKKEIAASKTATDELLVTIYGTISERVSKEISFSRELIMSAKKIWDARRSNDINLPTIPQENSLTEYPGLNPDATYIK
jgi:hypothetical protein